MSNARQVMQIALDALEYVVDQGGGPVCEHQAGGAVCFCKENEAINALRKELAAHPQATEPAPSTAVEPVTDAMVDAYLTEQRRTVKEADRFGRPNIGGLHTNTVREACRNGIRAALLSAPALPAAAMPVGELTDEEIISMARTASTENFYKAGRFIRADFEPEEILTFARAILAAARTQPVRSKGKHL